jgi:hypothetical protein
MPVDWNELLSTIDQEIEQAAQKTDEKLAAKISSITRLTEEEIRELFPAAADVRRLAELMKIVKGAEARNTKITKMVYNAENFAGIIIDLLKKLA